MRRAWAKGIHVDKESADNDDKAHMDEKSVEREGRWRLRSRRHVSFPVCLL